MSKRAGPSRVGRWWLPSILAGVLCIQILTMPMADEAGDPLPAQMQAAYFIGSGSWGIDYLYRDQIPEHLLAKRGQYFFENDEKQRYFSKYGFGQSLVNLPPLLVYRFVAGAESFTPQAIHEMVIKPDLLRLIFNIYQALLAVGVAAYLYRLAALYSDRAWVRAVFVASSIYTTITWHYLRTMIHEVHHFVPFLGFFYHALCFLRADPDDRRRGTHLLWSVFWVALLIFMKVFYLLLLAGLGVFVLWKLAREHEVGAGAGRWIALATRAFRQTWWRLVLPTLFIGAVVLAVNDYKFGSPTHSGYGQWDSFQPRSAGLKVHSVKPTWIKRSLPRLIVKPGNSNVFLHYPLLLFALFGTLRFYRRFPLEAQFVLWVSGTCCLALASMSVWSGEWCYGPRLFLPFLMVGSLPVLGVFERCTAATTAKGLRRVAGTGIVVVAAGSLMMQIAVNSVHHFAFYHADYLFRVSPSSPRLQPDVEDAWMNEYFHPPHRAWVSLDMLAHRFGLWTFPPLVRAENHLGNEEHFRLAQLREAADRFAILNLYWWRPPAG